MSGVAPFNRTLDQELVALLRGVSLECLVCGEFVMQMKGGAVFCPECGSRVTDDEVVLAAGATAPANAG